MVSLTTAIALILVTPFNIVVYLATDSTMALLGMIIPVLLGNFYQATTFSQTQGISELRMRAVAAGILLFIINIIGLGFGPQVVGVISDLLSDRYGTESLRYALLICSLVNIWAGIHYFLAGRHLKDDLVRARHPKRVAYAYKRAWIKHHQCAAPKIRFMSMFSEIAPLAAFFLVNQAYGLYAAAIAAIAASALLVAVTWVIEKRLARFAPFRHVNCRFIDLGSDYGGRKNLYQNPAQPVFRRFCRGFADRALARPRHDESVFSSTI